MEVEASLPCSQYSATVP